MPSHHIATVEAPVKAGASKAFNVARNEAFPKHRCTNRMLVPFTRKVDPKRWFGTSVVEKILKTLATKIRSLRWHLDRDRPGRLTELKLDTYIVSFQVEILD